MYDLTARKTVDEVSISGGVRYVVWAQNGAYAPWISPETGVFVALYADMLAVCCNRMPQF